MENLGISSGYGARLFAPISFRSERRRCQELLKNLGSQLRLDTLVADLTPAARSAIQLLGGRARWVLKGAAGCSSWTSPRPTWAGKTPIVS